jgi:uncharacterized membrane protein
MVPSGALTDLSGSVGTVDNAEEFSGLGLVPRVIYSIGDRECHQIDDRSYFLNDNQMPFCARDLGLFLGLAAGFGVSAFVRFRVNPVLLLIGLAPMAVDGGLQLLTDYESSNALRVTTGLIGGIGCSLLMALFIVTIKEDLRKPRDRQNRPGRTEPPAS